MFASFTGIGADAKADPVFEHLDPAARALEEALAGDVRIGGSPVLGPIQGIALRRR